MWDQVKQYSMWNMETLDGFLDELAGKTDGIWFKSESRRSPRQPGQITRALRHLKQATEHWLGKRSKLLPPRRNA
ncbi:hypothetical protein [Calidithermus chliarophilus]|uniref:hypothetical protein n=1 Tax=Calidithermus chliarophilus TaxID=52023 RepID=UPI0012F6EC8B|nr:hypothetical protein [Calidithermus chliarophilus]